MAEVKGMLKKAKTVKKSKNRARLMATVIVQTQREQQANGKAKINEIQLFTAN